MIFSLYDLETGISLIPLTSNSRHISVFSLLNEASLRRENTEICLEFDVKGIKEIPVSKSYNEKIMESFVTYSKQK